MGQETQKQTKEAQKYSEELFGESRSLKTARGGIPTRVYPKAGHPLIEQDGVLEGETRCVYLTLGQLREILSIYEEGA